MLTLTQNVVILVAAMAGRYTEWTNFLAIGLNIETEAGALQNIYSLAEGLPPVERAVLQRQAQAYAVAAIESDWPEMAAGQLPESTRQIDRRMWQTLMSVHAETALQITAQNHAITQLSVLTQGRRTRLLQSQGRLPLIFWYVLVVGGVLSIASVATFGTRVRPLHVFQVGSLTLLVTLAMLAIADLDRPSTVGSAPTTLRSSGHEPTCNRSSDAGRIGCQHPEEYHHVRTHACAVSHCCCIAAACSLHPFDGFDFHVEGAGCGHGEPGRQDGRCGVHQ